MGEVENQGVGGGESGGILGGNCFFGSGAVERL